MKKFADYVPEAKKIADAKSDSGTTYKIEWILVELMLNDLSQAVSDLQEATKLHHESLTLEHQLPVPCTCKVCSLKLTGL